MAVMNMTMFVLLMVVMMMVVMGTMVEAVGLAEVKDKEEECCEPRHVHLALGEAADLVQVMWETRSPCQVTQVTYGTSPWQLQFQVTGKSVTLTGPHSGAGGRYLHRAVLMGLQEGMTYFYRPICNRIGSGPFYFKSPYASANWSPQVLVTGELGAGTELLPLLAQRTLSGQFSATLELGGLSAYLADDNGTREDQVLQSLQQTAAFLPLMTSPGDDERGGDSLLRLYSHVFAMPGAPWPPPVQSQAWYSFDLGPVHFVSVCTGVYVHGSGHQGQQGQARQLQWLKADLLTANKARNSRPWIVVFTHHPFYCSPRQPQDVHCAHSRAIRAAGLEDLLFSQGVDLILQSHSQGYQRFYPLYKGLAPAPNYTQPQAPVHIVLGSASSTIFPAPPSPTTSPLQKSTENGVKANSSGDGQSGGGGGGGGGSSGGSGGSNSSSSSDGGGNADKSNEDIVAFEMLNGTDLTYGRLLVLNATHAHWELLSGAAGREGEIMDQVWLVQDNHGPFHLKDLPQEVEDKIQHHSSTSSQGKPDVLNSQGGSGSNLDSQRHNQRHHPLGDVLSAVESHRGLALGLSLGAVTLMLALMVLACRLRRRRPLRRRGMVTRRWDTVDYKYGKTKLSNDVDDDYYDDEEEEEEFKDGNDQGNGMGDGLQTKRLITTRR